MRKQEEEKVLNFHQGGYQFSSLTLSEVLKTGQLNIGSNGQKGWVDPLFIYFLSFSMNFINDQKTKIEKMIHFFINRIIQKVVKS